MSLLNLKIFIHKWEKYFARIKKITLSLEGPEQDDNIDYFDNTDNFEATEDNSNLPSDENEEGGSEHQCLICGKCFDRLSHLKRHKASIHDGKKPFACELCPKSFTQSNKLKEHISNVHERNKPYQCAACGYSAGLKGNVKHHIRGKHKGADIEILYLGKDKNSSSESQNYVEQTLLSSSLFKIVSFIKRFLLFIISKLKRVDANYSIDFSFNSIMIYDFRYFGMNSV